MTLLFKMVPSELSLDISRCPFALWILFFSSRWLFFLVVLRELNTKFGLLSFYLWTRLLNPVGLLCFFLFGFYHIFLLIKWPFGRSGSAKWTLTLRNHLIVVRLMNHNSFEWNGIEYNVISCCIEKLWTKLRSHLIYERNIHSRQIHSILWINEECSSWFHWNFICLRQCALH